MFAQDMPIDRRFRLSFRKESPGFVTAILPIHKDENLDSVPVTYMQQHSSIAFLNFEGRSSYLTFHDPTHSQPKFFRSSTFPDDSAIRPYCAHVR